MYYFDNKTLAQYIDQNIDLEVYVGEEWFQITDLSDVSNPKLGIAYDLYGAAQRFDYREIEQIRAGTNIVTLEMLQTQKGSAPPTDEPAKSKPAKEPAVDSLDDEPLDDEPKSGKKEPDLSWFSPLYDVGRQLMIEAKRKKANK